MVFIHGGAIDDYVAYLLLTTMEEVDLQGVVLTNTDSVSDYAMLGQWKMQSLLGREDDPVGLSAALVESVPVVLPSGFREAEQPRDVRI